MWLSYDVIEYIVILFWFFSILLISHSPVHSLFYTGLAWIEINKQHADKLNVHSLAMLHNIAYQTQLCESQPNPNSKVEPENRFPTFRNKLHFGQSYPVLESLITGLMLTNSVFEGFCLLYWLVVCLLCEWCFYFLFVSAILCLKWLWFVKLVAFWQLLLLN